MAVHVSAVRRRRKLTRSHHRTQITASADAKLAQQRGHVYELAAGWERLKDDRGGLNSIIANDNVNPGARVSITVKRGEFFSSKDCGICTRV